MNFSINLPVRIISGSNCIEKNANLFCIGKSALIVTGKNGAKKSGALDDILSVLSQNKIDFTIFDSIKENPPIEKCFEGGALCADMGADFVIGIGGGSAIDAAKAIAAFATNQQITMDEIFNPQKRINKALPIIAVPTTSGTGTEANPYSVLSLEGGEKKKTFAASDSWSKYAFLDPKYTFSLSKAQTLSTALDAFAHSMESYLSPKSTEISGMMALYAASHIWDIIKDDPDDFTENMHERLLCASCAAGIAISVTGTGFPHPLGYSITMLDGIPHGAACAIFDGDYIKYNRKTPAGAARLEEFADFIDADLDLLERRLPQLSKVNLSFTEEEIEKRVNLICDAKNYLNSPYILTKEDIFDIYRNHFLKK